MTAMHDDFVDRLSEYLDDELPEADRAEVAAHIAACAECAQIVAELSSVSCMAAALPVTAPERDLWPGIAERVMPSPAAQVLHLPRRRISISVFELIAAGIVLAVASGVIATRWLTPGANQTAATQAASSSSASAADDVAPAANGEPGSLPARVIAASLDDTTYDAAVADLESVLRAERSRLDPSTVRIVEDNLAIINQALEDAQRALAADPADSFLGEHLAQTRRRKLDLLRRAATLTQRF
jgi:hypothetical protein